MKLDNGRNLEIINLVKKGETFEKSEVVSLILNLKDVDKKSFNQISEHLNELGLTTITGKKYKQENVVRIYNYNKNLC